MHKMVAFSKAVDGQADALAHWYDTQHMRDLLDIPGMVSAERHRVQPLGAPAGTPAWDFMLVYEIDAADPMTVIRTMGERRAAGRMPWTDVLESESSLSLIGLSAHRLTAQGQTASEI